MTEPITSWREIVTEGEEAMLTRLAEELRDLAKARVGKDRALHVKQHAGLRARLTIEGNLPATLAHGLFARPAEHRAYVRLSNGTGRSQHDAKPDFRGLAIKVLGVEGDKELGTARTQDFLFIDPEVLPFRTPHEFIALVRSAGSPPVLVAKLVGALGFRAFGLLADLAKVARGDRGSVLDLAYHTIAPVRVGPHAARLHLEPLHHPSPHARAGSDRDYLRRELEPRVRAGGIAWALSAQCAISDAESVEDVTRPWSGPSVRVGKLALEADDPTSAEGKRLDAFVRELSFDPWHCLREHRPLGLTMRARKHAYFASTQHRGAAPEPDGSEWPGFHGS